MANSTKTVQIEGLKFSTFTILAAQSGTKRRDISGNEAYTLVSDSIKALKPAGISGCLLSLSLGFINGLQSNSTWL